MASVEDIEDAVEQGTQTTTTGNNKKGKTVTFDDGSVLTQKGFKFVYTDADGNEQPIGMESGLKNRVDGSKNKALTAVLNKIKSDKTEEIIGTFNSGDADAYLASEKAEAERLRKKDKDAFYGKNADSTGKITSGKDKGKDSPKKQWMDSLDPSLYNYSDRERLGMALTDIGELFTANAGDGQSLGVLSNDNQNYYDNLGYPITPYKQGQITETQLPPFDPNSAGSDFSINPYGWFDADMSGSSDNSAANSYTGNSNNTNLNNQGTDTGGVTYGGGYNPEDQNNDGFTDPVGGVGGGGSGGGSSVSSVVDGLLEAIAERDAALARKQGSLTDRYAEFGDTYMTNLNDAYGDLASGDYDTEYEAAKASIWNNIKAQGLLDQTDVDARLSKVNDAYAAKDETINTLADAFTSGIRSQLGGTYDSTLSGLNALAIDGSSPEDYINQTQAINSFDVITPFNQYSSVTPNEEDFENIDMFEGFDQYYGKDDLSTAFDESDYNVQAVSASPDYQGSASTISAADAIKSASRDPFGTPIKTSTIKNPFGSNVRMVV